MGNSQYERDFNDLGALKRPGRLDFRILNNVDDAGDGYPGMQKAIRNYFHEGYLEKDINMNTHKIINLQAPSGNNDGARKADVDTVQNDLNGFDDELKSLSAVEVQQLQNINSVTINNTQWGFVESMQAVAITSNVAFGQITMGGNIIMGANNIILGVGQTVDTVDVSAHDHSGSNQGGTVAHSSTGGRTANNHHNQSHILTGGDHTASALTIGHVIRATTATTFAWQQLGHGDLSGIGSNAHSVIDDHITSTATPHVSSAEKTNWNSAHSHISTDGSSHSFIDQSVIITASPTFNGLTINGNIVVTGSVDDVNISTHATNNSAHHTKYTNTDARASISNIIGSDGHLDSDLDADQHRIVDLANPISDNDAAIRSSLGEGKASTVVQHTNNAEKTTNSDTYIKLKEVIVYRNLKDITIKWEMKSNPGNGAYCKVYVNGIAVGIEKHTNSPTYVTVTNNISNIYTGDLIQIYARSWDSYTDASVINMEIRYDFLFTSNDP